MKTKIEVRLTEVQKEKIKLKAKSNDVNMSEYILSKVFDDSNSNDDVSNLLKLKVMYVNLKKKSKDLEEINKIDSKIEFIDIIILDLTKMLNGYDL